MSGGERQRIVLARAFIKKPDILILDEATSSLDLESENLIYQSIKNLSNKMTIIIITHRLSFLKQSNKIFVIEKGKIIDSGNYKDLINQMIHSFQDKDLNLKVDKFFYDKIIQFNDYYVKKQVDQINKGIQLITSNKKYNIPTNHQIRTALNWCRKYNVPINNYCYYLK